jgi:hypothetical protein
MDFDPCSGTPFCEAAVDHRGFPKSGLPGVLVDVAADQKDRAFFQHERPQGTAADMKFAEGNIQNSAGWRMNHQHGIPDPQSVKL